MRQLSFFKDTEMFNLTDKANRKEIIKKIIILIHAVKEWV